MRWRHRRLWARRPSTAGRARRCATGWLWGRGHAWAAGRWVGARGQVTAQQAAAVSPARCSRRPHDLHGGTQAFMHGCPAQRHAKLLRVAPQVLPDAACAPLPPRRPPRRAHTRSGGCSSTPSWSASCSAAPLWRQSATGRASLGMSRTS